MILGYSILGADNTYNMYEDVQPDECAKYRDVYANDVIDLNGPYYWFKVQNIVAFDAEGRGTRFLGYNEKCDGYEELIGATPVYLKEKGPGAEHEGLGCGDRSRRTAHSRRAKRKRNLKANPK